jgi:ATP-dependent helicase/nuclease subunit B
VPVAPEALAELRDNVGSRLYEVLIAAQAGAPLPANGDDGICAWCDYRGVCRRDDWVEPAPPTAS